MPTRATPCPDTTPAAATALPGALEPDWLEDGTPYSARYGDVYYTRGEGAAEAEHVFLSGNGLRERWCALPDTVEQPFLIAETGFGTGLNFLLALRLWRAVAPRGSRLLYRSVEAEPLSREALSRALAAWPALEKERRELIDRWPPALAGLHALNFDDDRVTLQLFVGEAGDALEEFQAAVDGAAVDAWFLDGFAPARNPDMWRSDVLARIAALTRCGGTLATFTSAAAVRRGLQDAGFAMRKVPGFGRKREMLCGTREAREAPVTRPFPTQTPWHRAEPAVLGNRRAVVVGAGIAGCLTARALALRGWEVLVLEASDAIAEGASGNPQGLLYTQLPAADSAHGEFTLASYLHACRTHAQ
ncbi:MAG: tRNA (5-methylaminomethyl-2-thiouridine)(34)-methyltransferase MnmD, partial [Gammaproteobacteria bacterium]